VLWQELHFNVIRDRPARQFCDTERRLQLLGRLVLGCCDLHRSGWQLGDAHTLDVPLSGAAFVQTSLLMRTQGARVDQTWAPTSPGDVKMTVSLRMIVLGAAVLGPAAALAQTLPPEANNPAVRAAASQCQGDIQKFCPNVQPGGGRIVRCLVANKDGVSAQCRDSILKAKAALGY
jgi:hypothetical protein